MKFSEKITYFKNTEKIITDGVTEILLENKYKIKSKNINFFMEEQLISSKYSTQIKDKNSNIYNLEKFNYEIDKEILKGNDIVVITNYNLPKSDKFFFKSAIIDLKKVKIIAKDTEVKIHKKVFNNSQNDPRLKGISSYSDEGITIINKGIFTSCKKTDNCPPWSIQAEKIIHDKSQKQLNYKNAIVKVYDIPILYFPKFFHPDPSVKRQSGLLKPQLNNSNTLGNSLKIPYYKVLKENSDYTITPTIFDNNILMVENEYRYIDEFSNFEINFGFVKGYEPSTDTRKKNINNIFANYYKNLNLKEFSSSDFHLAFEKVNNDTFLKVFDQHINDTDLKPNDQNILESNLKFNFVNEEYSLDGGFTVYEDLEKNSSDRYQYVLPYFNFNKNISENF